VLPTPSNGAITECTFGNIGIGRFGHICYLECNTGYQLVGNDSRICQSDGSWNGNETVCESSDKGMLIVIDFLSNMFSVACSSLTNPDNGVITCSLGDDGVPSYKDTCSFTCNTGYELTGSDTRTCQSDGSWSGSETMCTGGYIMYFLNII